MYSLEKDSGDFFGSITYLYPFFAKKFKRKIAFCCNFFSLPLYPSVKRINVLSALTPGPTVAQYLEQTLFFDQFQHS